MITVEDEITRVVGRMDRGQLDVVSTFLAGLLAGTDAADLSGGACEETDPDAFYPDKGDSTRPAKRICARCDIRERCLEYALTHDERFGVWGGMSVREREVFRAERARRIAASAAA